MKLSFVDIETVFGSPFGRTKGIADFVSIIVFNATAIAGVLLFFLLIFGGISVIMGAGSGSKEDVAKGKKAITAAIAGFLIIFTAYWITRIIEAIAGFSILSPNP